MERTGRKGVEDEEDGEGRGEKQKNKKMGEIKKMIKGKFQTQIKKKTRIIQTKNCKSKLEAKYASNKNKIIKQMSTKRHKRTMTQACVIMNQDGYLTRYLRSVLDMSTFGSRRSFIFTI